MALKKTTEKTADLHPVQERAYERDADGLTAQLQDADAVVRRWAAHDLAAHPATATRLCARLRDEPDAGVREALFTSLARIGDDDTVRGLLPLLRSEDAGLRNGALEVLAGLPDVVAPCMGALLHDSDSDVRIFAVNLLTELRHPGVPGWLAEVLAHEAQVNVIGAALDVVAEVGTAAMRPALRAVCQRFADEPYIEFAASLAMERIAP
jgi:HEAT repeat protein